MTDENKQLPEKPVTANITSDEKYMSAASYVPGLFILPVLFKPKSEFCQFHGKQGLGMSVLFFVVLFLLALMPMLGSLVFLLYFGLAVVGGMKAIGGEKWKIPVLGDFVGKVDLQKMMSVPTTPKKAEPTQEPAPATATPTEAPAEPAPTPTPQEEPPHIS